MVGGTPGVRVSRGIPRYNLVMAAEMTEQVMIRLTPDLLDQIKAASADQERTVAQTVRLAIKAYLNSDSTTAATA